MDSAASTPSLTDVVKQFDELHVADYQRTYSWQKEQIEELFEDLKATAKTPDDAHFFGTLILHATSPRKADLVDGQQRLTTAFILVSALRDEILLTEETIIPAKGHGRRPINVLDKAWNFLYPGDDFNEPRFRSNRFLAEMMAKSVIAEPEAQTQLPARDSNLTLPFRKAVKSVRDLVKKDLKGFDTPLQKLERINELLDTLLNQFIVLQVTTSSYTESVEIFLTLNNRGLPLGPSDLVRGQIMSQLAEGESERNQVRIFGQIFTEWQTISDQVKEPEVFLRHYLVSTGRSKVQKKKVQDRVSDRIKHVNREERKALARDFWDDLESAAETYSTIIEPRMGGECQYQIELLEGLTKSHRILLLRIFANEIDATKRDAVVRSLFILTYRWVMSGGNAQELEDFYQTQANDFGEHDDIDAVIASLTRKSQNLEFDVYRYLRSEGDSSFACRALLHAVNRALTPGANPIPLNGDLHLEHIAPQSSTPEWVEALLEGDTGRYPEYEQLKSEIGNLTLLDVKLNMKAKRKLFQEKHSFYNKSTMKISRDLARFDNWTSEMVVLRSKWLAEMFEILWSIEPSDKSVVAFHSWMTTR